jgi:hypothetical protein
MKKELEKRSICAWIGEGEQCRHPTIFGKSYCETHHERVYLTLFPEMATYIIEQELNSTSQNTN